MKEIAQVLCLSVREIESRAANCRGGMLLLIRSSSIAKRKKSKILDITIPGH